MERAESEAAAAVAGWQARLADQVLGVNPFDLFTTEYRGFKRGWWAAQEVLTVVPSVLEGAPDERRTRSLERVVGLLARWRVEAAAAKQRCDEGWEDIDGSFEAAKCRTYGACADALEAELAGKEPNGQAERTTIGPCKA